MDEINATWLGAILAKHSKDSSIVDVLGVETEPAVGDGENYSSSIVRATIKVVLGSGKITSRKVIVKIAHENLSEEVKREICNVFNIEGILYNKILSTYETLISENSLGYNKLWADCLMASHNIIIFEDLKTSGFKSGPRKNGLDPIHAELVVENLARIHSLSLVAESAGDVLPGILPRYLIIDSVAGGGLLKTCLKALADVIQKSWSSEWSRVEAKLRSMVDNLVTILSTLYDQQHKLSVINHGDCWISNMMFKYNSEGKPTEQKFVDFQVCHYNSYAWDLSHFFHTSLHPKYLSTHLDSFIEIYCKEFARNLKLLQIDVSKAPTIDDVKSELTRLLPFSLIVACSIMPIVFNPADVKLDLNELVSDSSKAELLHKDKEFEKTLQLTLSRFIDLGIL